MALCHRDGENSIYDYAYAEFSEIGEWGLGGGIKESVLVTPAGLSNRAMQFHRKGAVNYCKIVKI